MIDLAQAVVCDRGYVEANCFELQDPLRTYRFVADDEVGGWVSR